MRTAQLDGVTIAKNDDTGTIEIPGFHLLGDTDATPGNPTAAMAPGYDRRAGRLYNVVVVATKPEHFDTLDGWQRAGELLNVTFHYTDDSSAKYLDIGFTVKEETSGEFGNLEGFRIEGVGTGESLSDVVTLAPVLPT